MIFEEIFTTYKPKEGLKILKGITTNTGRYFASVYKEVIVSKGRKVEIAETSLDVIATADLKEYIKLLQPYIQLR